MIIQNCGMYFYNQNELEPIIIHYTYELFSGNILIIENIQHSKSEKLAGNFISSLSSNIIYIINCTFSSYNNIKLDSYFNLEEFTKLLIEDSILENFIDNDKISLQGMLGNEIYLLNCYVTNTKKIDFSLN